MLGDNLKRLRLERGLSQEELAEKLYVVRQTVSKWEKGLSVPDAEMLIRLSEVLGVTASELLGEESAADNIKIENRKGRGVMKVVFKIILGILVCYLIFVIIQTVFGIGVSVDTEVTENIVPLHN